MIIPNRPKSILLLLCALVLGAACTKQRAPLGSEKNPIKIYFLPSVDAQAVADKAAIVKKYLESNTPYKYEVAVPSSYVAIVEAFGTKRADVSMMNTFGYLMANERYGAKAYLTAVRFGLDTYQSQIIVRTDSSIKSLEDLTGKKFAFVDAASTSGYFMPAKLFQDKNIKLGETVFAKRHDNVVTMLYQKQVDAGATFYTPPADGSIQDARRLVKTQFPDVESKIRILTLTDSIPNDPLVIGQHVPEEIRKSLIASFLKLIESPEGKDAFFSLYAITGLKPASDETYTAVRGMLTALGKSASDLVK